MRDRLNDGEERPDADLRERLHAMEAKVRKMRETRNNFNAQAKVSAEKETQFSHNTKSIAEK